MKEGHQGVTAAIPVEMIARMDRLRSGSRTHHVNMAVKAYLEIQGPPVNPYGVDCDYFRGKLAIIQRDIGSYRPEELRVALTRLADTVRDTRRAVDEIV